MHRVIAVLKITSLSQPDKIWDSAEHLIYTSQDRDLMKKYIKGLKKDLKIKINMRDYKIVSDEMLSFDRKSVIHLFCGPLWIFRYHFKHLWKPHEDKGIWKTELLVEEDVVDIGKPFLSLLKDYTQVKNLDGFKWRRMQSFRGGKHGFTSGTKRKKEKLKK